LAKNVLITPAQGNIKFEDTAVEKASIYEQDGNLYISSTDGNVIIDGTVYIGDGTATNLELGDASSHITMDFLGGGDLTASGGILNIGLAGDTVNLNIPGAIYNLPSDIVRTSDFSDNAVLTMIKNVDGTGSGLDADTVDGIHGTSFIRSDTNDDFTGTLNYTPSTGTILSVSGTPALRRFGGSNSKSIGLGADDTTFIGAGESVTIMSDNIADGRETVEIGGDSGVNIHVSPDNWASWAARKTLSISYTDITWDNNSLYHGAYHPLADKLTTARTISLGGDVSGSTSFDGSGNVSITATVVDDSHNHIIANVDGLQTTLDGKSNTHTHPYRSNDWLPTLAEIGASATSHNHEGTYLKLSEGGTITKSSSGEALTIHATPTESDISIKLGISGADNSYWMKYYGTGAGNTNDFAIESSTKTLLRSHQDGIVNFPEGLQKGGVDVSTVGHTHTIANTTSLQTTLDGKVNTSQVLTNVPSGAVFTDTVYTHPASHAATVITQDSTHRFTTDTEKTTWNAKSNFGGSYNDLTNIPTSFTPSSHSHNEVYYTETEINSQMALKANASQVLTNVPAGAKFTDTTYTVADAGLTEKNFTSALKTKLDGIATSANNYTHPSTHAASVITEDSTKRFVSDAEKAAWSAKSDVHSHPYRGDSWMPTPAEVGALAVGANAVSASKLATARSIALAGDVTGSANFDGSGNISITAVVVDDSHNHVISNVDGLQTALDAKASITALNTAIATSAYGIKYKWTNSAGRTAQTGMINLEQGVQEDTREVYQYNGTAWTLFYSLDAVHTHDDRYFTESEITSKLALKSDTTHSHTVEWASIDGVPATFDSTVHTHDDRYFTETEVTTKLALKSDVHSHPYRSDTWFPTYGEVGALGANSNAVSATKLLTSRTIELTGDATGSASFNGTANATITVVVQDDSHNHIISNVDGLQTALDSKLNSAGGTVTGSLIVGTGTSNTAKIGFNIANAGSPQLDMSDTGGDNYWSMGADGADNTFKIKGSTGALTTINNLANPHLAITTSGNVGIGVNTPTEKLDVSGNAKVSGDLTVGAVTMKYDATTKSMSFCF
jgi:hypothetical protein